MIVIHFPVYDTLKLFASKVFIFLKVFNQSTTIAFLSNNILLYINVSFINAKEDGVSMTGHQSLR